MNASDQEDSRSGDDLEPLIRRASQGDAVSVDALLERYLPNLQAYIRMKAGRLIQGRESISDLAQSVCREMLQNADRFQYGGEVGFKNWLFTTALRKIQNRHKFYRVGKRDVEREVPIDAGPEGEPWLVCYDSFFTPSGEAALREEREILERTMDILPDDHREVIVLAYVIGMSRAEIAQEMGRSEVAVRSLLSRALASLSIEVSKRRKNLRPE